MRILVTGSAGFIGFHVARRLLKDGHEVVGVDGMTPYYDVGLKRSRHDLLRSLPGFEPHEFMIEEGSALADLFGRARPEIVVHLAAQAGVRHSIASPQDYVSSNLVGTFKVIEACRHRPVQHLLLASTSSVYGANREVPFRETDMAVHPLTLYAATKQSSELMAHCYAHLFGIPVTAFRFFTVYGPWGRPDMALFLFVRKILAGEPIEIFNHGRSERDFTYIDDLVESLVRLMACIPGPPAARSETLQADALDTLSPVAPFRVVNIGAGQPVSLGAFVDEIERALGAKADRHYRDLPPGDVERTHASADLLERLTGYRPATPISQGIPAFVAWYRDHYKPSAQ